MLIIPINKKINCERMLKTGKFQSEHWHADECVWLIKYLRTKKKSEKEVFEKWKFFWKQHKPEYDDDDFKQNYKSFSGNATTVLLKDYPKTVVYQDEIDYINSLPLPLWMRQYVYILLIHSKTTCNDKYDHLPYADYHWWLSIKNNHSSDHKAALAVRLKELGIIKIVHVKEDYELLPEIDEFGNLIGYERNASVINDRLQFCLPVVIKHQDNKIVYDTIVDALGDINKINDAYRCDICGKKFRINTRTQRYICDECWNNKRKNQSKLLMRKKRKNEC